MERQGLEEGIFAIKNIDPTIADWLNTEPPLGTVDEDGNPTSEVSTDTCVAGTYKKSQAVKGMFEQIFGKNSFSVNIDANTNDSKDITTGNDISKSYQNVTGTFEFDMLNDDSRWFSAMMGNWNYLARGIYSKKTIREYEQWVLFSPDKKTLYATEAERLWKFIGLKIKGVEVDGGQPSKFRVPFFARRVFMFPSWEEPTPETLLTGTSITDDATYSLSTPITTPDIFHTRLKFAFTLVKAGTKSLVVRGYNIYGEPVTEDVDLSAESGSFDYITKAYFSSVNTLGILTEGGWKDTWPLMTVTEYDVGLLPS